MVGTGARCGRYGVGPGPSVLTCAPEDGCLDSFFVAAGPARSGEHDGLSARPRLARRGDDRARRLRCRRPRLRADRSRTRRTRARGRATVRRSRRAGVRRRPLPDRTVPDPAAVLPTLHGLARRLRDGAHVVTHCRAGLGRSSLLAASLLVLNGIDPDTAWSRIERARGLAVPDTAEQRRWPAALLGQL
ncbi:hypothetical protein ACWGB8_24705 [Kitasatospora sp. NPDC054939]